jgi:Tfp pilus assembly protein PilF
MIAGNAASEKLRVSLIYAGLAVATIIAYEPVRYNEFVDFDDNEYVTENARVKGGISGDSVVSAFTTPHFYMWHPLTSLSHTLDCEVFGLNPLGHHLVSLLFHVANSLLVLRVLKRMTGALWRSAFVAAVFALHPLSVESVAWASERKNVLSTFFWLLTIAAYIRYAERPSIGRYLWAFSAFCLGVLAKPMVVTLPFVLLLLDFWPLCRLQLRGEGKKNSRRRQPVEAACEKLSGRRLILEKIPLVILAAVLSVITFMIQRSGNIVASLETLPVSVRAANAVVSYVRYIGKMIWPSDLAMYYPYQDLALGLVIMCFVILAAVTAVVIVMRRRRYPLVGWLWFIGTLIPVIGLVQAGSQAMADRYTYVSGIGIYIIVGWGVAEIPSKWPHRNLALALLSCAALSALLAATRIQVRYWRDSSSVYEHTLAVTENNRIAHKLYGDFLEKTGRLKDAAEQYDKALKFSPGFQSAREKMGLTLLEMKEFDKAIVVLTDLLRAKPDWPEMHVRLAVAYSQKHQLAAAEKHFKEALRARPNWAEVYNGLGKVYSAQGRYEPAIRNFQEALRIKPDYPDASGNLARVVRLMQQAKVDGGAGEQNEK